MLPCAEEPLYLNDTSWFKLIIEVVLNEKKKKNQERDKEHARLWGWSGEGDKRSILKRADQPSLLFFSSESFLLN